MPHRQLPAALAAFFLAVSPAFADLGQRWPSEKRVIPDPVTGFPLTFLTSTDGGSSQSKIYPTHRQWTADGKWVLFRGNRGGGSQVFAVNEQSGDIVQVTANGFSGSPCAAHKSNKLYIMTGGGGGRGRGAGTRPAGAEGASAESRPAAPRQIVEIDLDKLFADSAAGTVKSADQYQRVCGTVPAGLSSDGNMGLDANDDVMYFRVTGPETAQLSPGQKLHERYGPRNMGAGPSGLRRMDLKTGETTLVCNVGFQMGHVQTNPWVSGQITFCWETGGKSPQRMWFVNGDGSGLKPLYEEPAYDWITHEAFISADEVAFAVIGHRGMNLDPNGDWGIAGSKKYPTGVGVINVKTDEMRLAGQVPVGARGRSVWHVHGSADGRWLVADDFDYQLWIIDRRTNEMTLLAGPQKVGADHVHPTFNADGTKVSIQSALISKDNRALNICVVDVPKAMLERKYPPQAGNAGGR